MDPVHEEDDDQGEVFLDKFDIIHELTVDDEDLPDADDDTGSDGENAEGIDDSIHIFTGHTSGLSYKEMKNKMICRENFDLPLPNCNFGKCMDLCMSKNYIILYAKKCLHSVTCEYIHFC